MSTNDLVNIFGFGTNVNGKIREMKLDTKKRPTNRIGQKRDLKGFKCMTVRFGVFEDFPRLF